MASAAKVERPEFRALRYLPDGQEGDDLKEIIRELRVQDLDGALELYEAMEPVLSDEGRRFLSCNDRFYLLTAVLGRVDAFHPWLYNRCREVEADPDGWLDLWARYHYKSTICTLGGIVQEILIDPEITICILSCNRDIARAFLIQIQQEFENNDVLKDLFSDVCWAEPKKESPRWSRASGIVVKRKSNPKEATVEAWGLIDGQPTSRHYRLLVYDDIVTQDLVKSPERIREVTERWELSDNLGTHGETRKWHQGTRYHWGDTYAVILERGTLKERCHPATDDGTLTGTPVLLSPERWEQVKDAQRSTVAAQMLLDPRAGNEAIFTAEMFKFYEARPSILNVYIMIDPSKGRTNRSDRTAIAVVGVDQAGMYWLLDGYRHRMQLAERWQRIKELHQKWTAALGVQIVRVGLERYGKDVEDEALKLMMERDNYFFEFEELSWPYDGKHSKVDRVSRLEPDIRKGRFRIPSVVYRPHLQGIEGKAIVSVRDGKFHYEPYKGPSKLIRGLQTTNTLWRAVGPIKRIDEERNVYDVTSAFIEEASIFPFAPKDDLVDAVSRIYDMQPTKPVLTESQDAEARTFEDS